jgi:hypothetical protein
MGLLVEVVRGDVPGVKVAERIRAAETILDRGHGKAVQAVISVPSKAKLVAVMSAMSDEALLQIAKRGSTPPNEGPNAPGEDEGSIQAGAQPKSPMPNAYADAIDAEFTEIDPLS